MRVAFVELLWMVTVTGIVIIKVYGFCGILRLILSGRDGRRRIRG